MTVRKSTLADYECLLALYAGARERMRKSGNPTQWGTTKPTPETIAGDIESGISYVLENDGKICGTFVFFFGGEPTYDYIEDGAWPDDAPYGTIHRIASDGVSHGVLGRIIEYCASLTDNLRIDTHRDNAVMQHLLAKYGFVRCGTIYLDDGSPRIGYAGKFQKWRP